MSSIGADYEKAVSNFSAYAKEAKAPAGKHWDVKIEIRTVGNKPQVSWDRVIAKGVAEPKLITPNWKNDIKKLLAAEQPIPEVLMRQIDDYNKKGFFARGGFQQLELQAKAIVQNRDVGKLNEVMQAHPTFLKDISDDAKIRLAEMLFTFGDKSVACSILSKVSRLSERAIHLICSMNLQPSIRDSEQFKQLKNRVEEPMYQLFSALHKLGGEGAKQVDDWMKKLKDPNLKGLSDDFKARLVEMICNHKDKDESVALSILSTMRHPESATLLLLGLEQSAPIKKFLAEHPPSAQSPAR